MQFSRRSFDVFVNFVHEGVEAWYVSKGVANENVKSDLPKSKLFGLFKHLDNHYFSFEIPKKSGSTRLIEAPSQLLKMVQRGIMMKFEGMFEPESPAHGFTRHRNILSNAQPHVGAAWVLNVDIAGFFPSISEGRVFMALQLAPLFLDSDLAAILAKFCTRHGRLPQGAPTSPVLTNLISMRLDRRFLNLARDFGCEYTRYADDLTFSGPSHQRMVKLLEMIKKIMSDESFELNESKTRILGSSMRQEVTGLTTNSIPNSGRKYRRETRAMLHHWSVQGADAAASRNGFESVEKFMNSLLGRILFIQSIHASAESARMLVTFNRLAQRK